MMAARRAWRLSLLTVDRMTYAGDVSPTEAWELLERDPQAVLVDVRSQAEWAFVGMPDPTPAGKRLVTVEWSHWPSGQRNEAFLEQLSDAGVTAGPVVFLCRSGVRSQGAATVATAAGISPSYNVRDGFEGQLDDEGHRGNGGWRASGLPWRQS
jgi:rhodanese-related sulfurtransferase